MGKEKFKGEARHLKASSIRATTFRKGLMLKISLLKSMPADILSSPLRHC